MTAWEKDPLRIVQKVKIWPFYQMVYAKSRIYPRERDTTYLWNFEIQSDHLILTRRPDTELINKKKKKKRKKKASHFLDFVGPVDHTVKMK